jgi:hypothetical protein
VTSTSSAVTPRADRAAWDGLLPALLDDDPDELLVTEMLLERVDVVGELAGLVDGLAELLAQASALATRRAYESDLAHFTGWAARYGWAALPAAPQTCGATTPPRHSGCDLDVVTVTSVRPRQGCLRMMRA